MKVEDLKNQYPDEWLIVSVEKKDSLGMPLEGGLLAHSQDADAIWNEAAGRLGEFYVFYSGEILSDTAVIFRCG
jgi:hypothetical protein